MSHTPDDSLTDSVDAFCRRISISRRGFYNLIDRGEGPHLVRLGRRVLIRREAAEQWLRDRETAPAA